MEPEAKARAGARREERGPERPLLSRLSPTDSEGLESRVTNLWGMRNMIFIFFCAFLLPPSLLVGCPFPSFFQASSRQSLLEMGNGTEAARSTPPGPSASSTGSVQPQWALPQPLQRATISRLPAGLGLAREQMRQVEGEREGRGPFSAQPQLSKG